MSKEQQIVHYFENALIQETQIRFLYVRSVYVCVD